MKYQSQFDPSRENVGKTYRDLSIKAKESPEHVQVGDMANELMSSLVYDLNDTIDSNPYQDRSFFIQIHEKKDLQMPRAIHRTIRTFLWRPYPEDDTVVFWCDPKSNEVRFCWCLPHWSEMDNILANQNLFDHDQIVQLKAWKSNNLYHFGFMKDEKGNWKTNPAFEDSKLEFRAPKNLGRIISPDFVKS